MNKLTSMQKDYIENWDGNSVLSIYPKGIVGNQSFENSEKEKFNATEFWCAMTFLDDLEVPRVEAVTGKQSSIVGRIKWLKNNR